MTNQHVPTSGKQATRRPTFFWIAVGLLGVLLLVSSVAAVLLAYDRDSINLAGGGGSLIAAGILAAVSVVACTACALFAAVSLLRREAHRRVASPFRLAVRA